MNGGNATIHQYIIAKIRSTSSPAINEMTNTRQIVTFRFIMQIIPVTIHVKYVILMALNSEIIKSCDFKSKEWLFSINKVIEPVITSSTNQNPQKVTANE